MYKRSGSNSTSRSSRNQFLRRNYILTPTVSSQPVFVPGTIYNGAVIDIRMLDEAGPLDARATAYELGLWLAGLDSLVSTFDRLFTDQPTTLPDSKHWYKAIRLARSGLLRCSELYYLLRAANTDELPDTALLVDVADLIRDSLSSNEALTRAGVIRPDGWRVWREELASRLSRSVGAWHFMSIARGADIDVLPEPIRELITPGSVTSIEVAELCGIMREFASIHQALEVVGRMLRNDDPLKPTLLIFAFVYERTQTLIAQINNRLASEKDEESEFFIALDGASYSASMEIRKAFSQELSKVVGVRPAHLVYAHIEVAHSLLSAGFEEVIASFARSMKPEIKVSDLFASFRTKLEQSLILRSALAKTLRAVKAAEEEPSKSEIVNMRNMVELFNHEAFHFLYYKDKETVERFTEEVQFTVDPKDLVPILHRFGAYLETLLAAVSMRAVLAEHPFEDEA